MCSHQINLRGEIFMKAKLFGLVIIASLLTTAVFAETFRCDSDRGSRHECGFEGVGRVELLRQFSRTDCVLGRTWGLEGRHRVWVSNGCRAEFVLHREREESREEEHHGRRGRLVTCESENNTRHRCEVDTDAGVRISRTLSRNECIEGRTWGYDRRGIWVRNGCRAEFWVGGR
jgi:hypothetical protein